MSSFIVEGGHRLSGEIRPQGAKNEALQVISAVLLTDETIILSNIPEILDVRNLILLLQKMGVKVKRLAKGKYSFCARYLDAAYVQNLDFIQGCSALRGSILLVGPLLARLGCAYFPRPGGDKIGRRRVDTHILGMMKLGVVQEYDESKKAFFFHLPEGKQLKGCRILMDEASVTGTANILMASIFAKGKTSIFNAACEPYVQQLCRMLVSMGAHIEGIGSNLLTVKGCARLHGTQHIILPDMIEVGSFIGMAAMNRSTITIKDVSYEHLGIIPECFRRLGIRLEQRGDDIYVKAQESYEIESFMDGSIMTISDAPWPGFTPDLLSVVLVVATQCRGSVLIHQKMFESRLFFVDKLIDMGAQIILCDPHRAVVIGLDHKSQLHAETMVSPDIRAGIALLIAAMSAKGTSVIKNIDQIDRGYENIDRRLNALGAKIIRQ